MNIVSTVIGFIISSFLQDGLESKLMGSADHEVWISQSGQNWTTFMYMAFPVGYVLSIMIEHGVVENIQCISIENPLRTVAAANTVSYVLLAVISSRLGDIYLVKKATQKRAALPPEPFF